MAARLPTPNGDDGNWGTILNGFLSAEHNADGTHPAATTSVSGFVKLATNAQVNIGSDTTHAITPSALYSTQTLTDGANIDWDVSLGVLATVTLAGSRTLNNPTNLVNGACYILIIKQDNNGSRTITFSSAYKFPDGLKPTLSTAGNSVDILSFLSDGTNLYGSFQSNFG